MFKADGQRTEGPGKTLVRGDILFQAYRTELKCCPDKVLQGGLEVTDDHVRHRVAGGKRQR